MTPTPERRNPEETVAYFAGRLSALRIEWQQVVAEAERIDDRIKWTEEMLGDARRAKARADANS